MKQYWRLCSRSIVLRIGIVLVVISVVGFVIISCGSVAPTQSDSASIPNKAATLKQTAIQNCGNVLGYGNLVPVPRGGGSQHAENCFWQAFQQCQPATLVFSTQSMTRLSVPIIHTFTIHNSAGKCLLSDTKEQRSAPNGPVQIVTYTCAGLEQSPRVLNVLSCGQEGTVPVLGT